MPVNDPDLTLTVTLAADRRSLEYIASTPRPELLGFATKRFESDRFKQEPEAHFRDLFIDLSQMSPEALDVWLPGRSLELSEALLPFELQVKLLALSSSSSSIRTLQICSDETWIPWELLRLQDPHDDLLAGPFLVEAFNITRWTLESRFGQALALPLKKIGLIIPRNSGLPKSRLEGERIKTLGGEERQVDEIRAMSQEVRKALASGDYEGFHFTGHGEALVGHGGGSAHRWNLALEDGELSSSELRDSARSLQEKQPLVFLNACHSGRTAASLTGMAGLASAFLKVGAGAFIGSLWRLRDSEALYFAEELYKRLFQGIAIGEAVREARQALRNQFPGGNNWLSYTVFAHPLATCPEIRIEAPLPVPTIPVPVTPPVPEPLPESPTPQPPQEPVPVQGPILAPPFPPEKKEEPLKTQPVIGIEEDVQTPVTTETETEREVQREEPPLLFFDERINEKDGTILLYVPGGEITLGDERISPNSKPLRVVRISPFWIGKYPVTNAQYTRFLEANPDRPEPAFWTDPQFNGPEHPVVGVSWEEASAYCRWAGLELPSEAQWETAARGTDQRPYPWGSEKPTAIHANFRSNGTTPVGAFPAGAGPYGALDQAGNVYEWCADSWVPYVYKRVESRIKDPVVLGDEGFRSVRGGAWNKQARDLHAALRAGDSAQSRLNCQGFRCAWRPT